MFCKGWWNTTYPHHFLRRDNWEHPEQLHHYLTWQPHHIGTQDPATYMIVTTAGEMIRVDLLSIANIYRTRCIRKATIIVDNPTHPSHNLFTLLPNGKKYQAFGPSLPDRAAASFLRPSGISQTVHTHTHNLLQPTHNTVYCLHCLHWHIIAQPIIFCTLSFQDRVLLALLSVLLSKRPYCTVCNVSTCFYTRALL